MKKSVTLITFFLFSIFSFISCKNDKKVAERGVRSNNHPYSVAIEEKTGGLFWNFACSGLIIHVEFILTACHCVNNGRELRIIIGTMGISKLMVDSEFIHEVKSIHLLSEFIQKKKYSLGDLALLQLNEPLIFEKDNLKPISIDSIDLRAGQTGYLVGYGSPPFSNFFTRYLSEVPVTIDSHEKCKKESIRGNDYNSKKMFCSLAKGEQKCSDGGSGLLVKHQNRFILVGIVTDESNKCTRTYYTNITAYRENIVGTIKSVTKDDSFEEQQRMINTNIREEPLVN